MKRPQHIELTPGGFEDAFFWASSLGYHALFHAKATCGENASSVCGAYAWSTDSFHWHSSAEPVYAGEMEWEDGTVSQLSARQRPQLLFSEPTDGTDPVPVVLFNGVGGDQPGQPPSGRTWTMAQPFRM